VANQSAELIQGVAARVIDSMQQDTSDASALEMLMGIGVAYLGMGRTMGFRESDLVAMLAEMCASVRRKAPGAATPPREDRTETTAETITATQIRQLRRMAERDGDARTMRICFAAEMPGNMQARAMCADIFNAKLRGKVSNG
jgi:hypothetical protein